LLGYGFMGVAHSHAWRTAPRFLAMPFQPRLVAIAGRDGSAVGLAARQLGWEHAVTDWRRLLSRDDIDVIDVCVPGNVHEEVVTAALEHGKHVLCEKPLANSVAEAERMVAVAEYAKVRGVRAAVGFSYRFNPAVTLAHQLVRSGRIGRVQQVRAQYLQDWLVDDLVPLSWRLDQSVAGSGAVGDIGAHIVDLAHFVTGEPIVAVSGMLRTFVSRRPEPIAGVSALGGAAPADAKRAPVTVDDCAIFFGELHGGGTVAMEATRFATGRKNVLRFEVSGTNGAVAFDYDDPNALSFYTSDDRETELGFRRIVASAPGHPYADAWWPAGHGLGYEHGFIHEIADFVNDIADGGARTPTFEDGLAVQRVIDAVQRSSAANSKWTSTGLTGPIAARESSLDPARQTPPGAVHFNSDPGIRH
jgi:predicted dehydrogenase